MSLAVNLYDSRSLSRAINKVVATEPFVLNRIFGTKENHDADKIDIETVEGSSKVAQFVGTDEPNPRPTTKTVKTIQTVTIPRTYESKIFTVQQLRDFGALGGVYATAEERAQYQAMKVAQELTDLKERVLRLREKMAVDAIATGAFSVDQDNIAFSISYGFVNTTHLITLTGDDLWSASTTSDPIKNMKSWKRLIMQRSYQNAGIMLLGTSAAEYFLSHSGVTTQLDANNKRIGAVDLNSDGTVAATYLGKIMGVEIWEYVQQYKNAAGTVTDMFPVDRAVLVATGGGTNRLHIGPVERIANNGGIQTYNGEFLLEVDPRSTNTMLQWNCEQKSLPAIHDPGAVISAKVV